METSWQWINFCVSSVGGDCRGTRRKEGGKKKKSREKGKKEGKEKKKRREGKKEVHQWNRSREDPTRSESSKGDLTLYA